MNFLKRLCSIMEKEKRPFEGDVSANNKVRACVRDPFFVCACSVRACVRACVRA